MGFFKKKKLPRRRPLGYIVLVKNKKAGFLTKGKVDNFLRGFGKVRSMTNYVYPEDTRKVNQLKSLLSAIKRKELEGVITRRKS